jgi:uncharacterized protein
VLVQDEALKRAEAHLRELEAELGAAPAQGPAGFLDSMRDALLCRRDAPRAGSVPTVRPGVAGTGLPPGSGYAAAPGGAGGSFLGTAAAAAAGVIGGSLLLDGVRSMMGHSHGALAGFDPANAPAGHHASPWENTAQGDLARQAGLDDISRGGDGGNSGSGLFDASDDTGEIQDAGQFDEDFGGDGGFDGGFDGGSDSA